MNILVTLNSGYIKPLLVMLYSLCVNNTDEHIDVYVIHSSLTQGDFAEISRSAEGFDCSIHDLPVNADTYADVPFSDRLPKETYYRVFAQYTLPDSLDRILYLDPDLVVNRSIRDFYNMDMTGKMFAGATHVFSFVASFNRRRLNMVKDSIYINAGVMLINLEQLRLTPVTEHDVFGYIEEHRKHLWLFDQDVLNGLYSGQTLAVDEKVYNLCDAYIVSNNRFPPFRKKITIEWIRENSAILHFSGANKPWKPEYKGILKEFFDKYAQRFFDAPYHF